MGTYFGIPAAGNQMFQILFTCKNTGNSHNNHAMTLVLTDTGILLWDNTASSTVWSK